MAQNTTESHENGWIKLRPYRYKAQEIVNVMNIDNQNLLAISKSPIEDFGVNLFNVATNLWQSHYPTYTSNYRSILPGIIAATFDKTTQTLYILSKAPILLCIDFNDLRLNEAIEPRGFYLKGECANVTEILFENGRLHAIAHPDYLMWDTNNIHPTFSNASQTNSPLPICVHNHIENAKKNNHLLYANDKKKVLLYDNGGVHQLKIDRNGRNNTHNINNTNTDKNNLINNTNNHSNNNTNNNNNDKININSPSEDNKDEIDNENLITHFSDSAINTQYNQKWHLLTKFNSIYIKQFYPVIATDCGRYVLNFGASSINIHIHDIIHHQVFLSEIYCPSIGAVPRFATYLHDENQDLFTTNAYIRDCYSNISFKSLPVLPEYLIKFISMFVAIEFVHLFYDRFVRKNENSHWRINLDTILKNAKPLKPLNKAKKQ